MTIREIAERLDVSVPTLYRRLKAEGIDVKALRDDKTGKVTPAGASVIASLFSVSEDDAAIQEVIDGASQPVSPDTSCNDTELRVRAAVAEARLEAAERELERLRSEVDSLRAERDRLLSLLEGEQQQRQRLLLTESKRNWWSRLFKG